MSAKDEGEALVFVGTTDLAGMLRGKAFPAADWDRRQHKGVGWTPTNVQINCFNTIADTPFGALGDLALIPDPETRIRLPERDDRPALDFALGDIVSLEGAPWTYCTRSVLKRALAELREVAGIEIFGAFEHEFNIAEAPRYPGDAYSFRGYRQMQGLAEALMRAMRDAGLMPDTFMKEYGPGQYEVTNGPASGVGAADQAAILRMMVRDVAEGFDKTARFAPILDPDQVGNGVHIHISLRDHNGEPATYDAQADHGLSKVSRHFIGGVLAHLDSILALLAPSDVSYLRLKPHRWSAAYNNLGFRDREAAVRICPVSSLDEYAIARQFNFEIRACDAAASPHLALAALVFAGAEGLKQQIEPPTVTQDDISLWPESRLANAGLKRLPQSLPEALERFEKSKPVAHWFGTDFVNLYVSHKKSEIACLEGLDAAARCARYGEVY